MGTTDLPRLTKIFVFTMEAAGIEPASEEFGAQVLHS